MGSIREPAVWRNDGHGSRSSTAESALLDPAAAEQVVQVAHDLRSPLTSMLFLVEQLRSGRSGGLTPLMARQLAILHNATIAMSALVSDLMDVGRDGVDLLERAPRQFSLETVFGEIGDMVLPIAEHKGLTFRAHIAVADMRVGHPAAVRRVLLNLVTNAVKFTARGGVELRAEQSLASGVTFTVVDSGRGVATGEMATFLTCALEDGQPATPPFSSAGLGLVLCRKLVAEMDGAMEFVSLPGQGTRVTVTLPI
jgi:signal transduction histidine kinase